LKRVIRGFLESQGHEVIDFGTDSDASVDYPDYGSAAARAVENGEAELGLVFCWTGAGMAITANKLPGIRSAVVLNTDMAQLARQHNDVNVLSIPSKYVEPEQAKAIVQSWLQARFEGGRHARRLAKIESLEGDSHGRPVR
jgi:RpiB/LacA/LacB family sugar-phosphate isomerase